MAHVDDNPENTFFENLLLLCKSCNGSIEVSKHNGKPALPPRLHPSSLADRAWHCYGNGDYASSYGCYRLAAHLSWTRQADADFALNCISACIAALRPIVHERLFRSVMILSQELIASSQEPVDPFWKAECLSQIGLVLSDYKQWQSAAVFQKAAVELYNRTSAVGPYKRNIELKKAAALRRYAFVCQNTQVRGQLDELIELFRKRRELGSEATTRHVKAMFEFELAGSPSLARAELEQALTMESKIGNHWTVGEIHLLLGRICLVMGEKRKAKQHFERFLHIFSAFRLVPLPSRLPGCSEPAVELQRMGHRYEPFPQRRAFPLSEEELRTLLDLLKRS